MPALAVKQPLPFPSMRNMGPASWRMLQAVGITSEAQLRAIGALKAYVQVRNSGQRPSLNLLWALEGALSNRDWKQVAHEDRMMLLMQLDDLDAT